MNAINVGSGHLFRKEARKEVMATASVLAPSSDSHQHEQSAATKPTYTRAEVSQHNRSHDCWIIVQGKVYDVTKWLNKHPGGRRVLRHYAGEDATVRREEEL